MRCLEANKRTMWLSKPSQVELTDSEGIGTGEYVNGWSAPERLRINASAPTGDSSSSPFGTQTAYDLTLVADGNEWGISEGCRMWLSEDAPSVDQASGIPDMSGAYEVKRVSPSLNFCAFGLSRSDGR